MANRNIFNSIRVKKPKRNAFDLTHDVKLSMNAGELVPVCCVEAIPGDVFNIGNEMLIRMAPMVHPVMHRINATTHYFFVPNRLVWEKFTKEYMVDTEGEVPAFPTLQISGGNYSKLADYLGIPIPIGAETEDVSAIPFAAYQCVCNEYYRDQNLHQPYPYELFDGDNTAAIPSLLEMRRRAWKHDYFTSALPWAQKGDAVQIPIGSQNVILDPNWDPATNPSPGFVEEGGADAADGDIQSVTVGASLIGSSGDPTEILAFDPRGTLKTEDGGEATTINDLRRAFRLQEFLEKMARGGSRYVEMVLNIFGVRSSDARQNRPEYITGVKSPIRISEVLNTTGTEEAPQGNMAGHGVGAVQGSYGTYRVEEHGYIIGITSIMPEATYQQGIEKHFLKYTDKYQYFFPQFAHIGEQPIENREIMAFRAPGEGTQTFGYTPRYAEYRYIPNRVAGEFRTTLNRWHWGRIFSEVSPPQLNDLFVECNPDHRIFAVEDAEEEKFYVHCLNKIKAYRPIPKFGEPMF